VDIRKVSRALGHSSVVITERYYAKWNKAQQIAATRTERRLRVNLAWFRVAETTTAQKGILGYKCLQDGNFADSIVWRGFDR